MTARSLYQFPQSHFAEKARWLLDAKGLEYRARNLYPVLNRLKLWPRTGVGSIPALNDHGHWVGDSTAIALYLEQIYPATPLLSSEPQSRNRELAINRLSETLGARTRQLVMIHLIDTPHPATLYYQDAPIGKPLRAVATGVFRTAVKKMYRATPRFLDSPREHLESLYDQAERYVLARRSEFLVGDRLGLADIALCSMLGPVLAAGNSPWAAITGKPDIDPQLLDAREALAQRPLGEYVLATYAAHRNSQDNWRGEW